MKITIDTKEDSKEEMKKVLNLLASLIDGPGYTKSRRTFRQESVRSKDVFEQEGSAGMSAFAAMFGGSSSSENPLTSPIKEEESIAKRLKNRVEIVPY